jgi:hypothetical protein
MSAHLQREILPRLTVVRQAHNTSEKTLERAETTSKMLPIVRIRVPFICQPSTICVT